MKLSVILLAVVLVGCTTASQRIDAAKAQCTHIGFKPNTQAWMDCVVDREQRNRNYFDRRLGL